MAAALIHENFAGSALEAVAEIAQR